MTEHATTADAEAVLTSEPAGSATAQSLPEPPETGDLVIDAALSELAASDPDDLAAQLVAGERVDQTLRSRLADLGG